MNNVNGKHWALKFDRNEGDEYVVSLVVYPDIPSTSQKAFGAPDNERQAKLRITQYDTIDEANEFVVNFVNACVDCSQNDGIVMEPIELATNLLNIYNRVVIWDYNFPYAEEVDEFPVWSHPLLDIARDSWKTSFSEQGE